MAMHSPVWDPVVSSFGTTKDPTLWHRLITVCRTVLTYLGGLT